MDCLHSIAPDDEELLRFALDGEPLREEAREHLALCETCQQRLAMFKQVNTALTAHLYRSQCPSAEQLSFYCADLLPASDRAHIAAHILDCPLCSAEVADTRRFMAEVEPTPSEEFSPRAAVMRGMRRIAASLVRQQAQFVLRGVKVPSDVGWPRQYRAESVDLSLHLSRASNGDYLLLGILTSADNVESIDAFDGEKAELFAANDAGEAQNSVRSTSIDDLGNIVFSAVPLGRYTLLLHLPEREVVIEDITIE